MLKTYEDFSEHAGPDGVTWDTGDPIATCCVLTHLQFFLVVTDPYMSLRYGYRSPSDRRLGLLEDWIVHMTTTFREYRTTLVRCRFNAVPVTKWQQSLLARSDAVCLLGFL
jgi:hypothetical protein